MVLNAAMLGSLSPVEHLDPKELERVFKLNVLANQALIAAFDPLLRRAEKADVIGITSSVGEQPRAFWGGYGASKAAFDTMLGAYADETAHAGKLRVQIVDPGATRTRMRQLAFPGEGPDSLKGPEVVAASVVERLQGASETGSRYRVDA
jgi:NAD(P)-dependent dehydrogenase (short-subunit alcohol dehydrogenase family)